MRVSLPLVTLATLCIVVGCVTTKEKSVAVASPASIQEAADGAAAVFIGKPDYQAGALGTARQKLITEPAPQHDHDKSRFADRLDVVFEVVEVIKSPAGATRDGKETFSVTVAVALADNGPEMVSRGAAYDEELSAAMEQVLVKPYAVIFARPVYVDWGNSDVDPNTRAWVVGTDPSKPNKGFDTLEAAQTYVDELR